MQYQLQLLFQTIIADMGTPDAKVTVMRSENPVHGDYTTSIAMVLSKPIKRSPIDIAEEIKKRILDKKTLIESKAGDQNIYKDGQIISTFPADFEEKDILQDIESIEVVKPGFINVSISEAKLSTEIVRVIKWGNGATISPKQTILSVPQESEQVVKKFYSNFLVVPKTIMVEFAHPNTHKAFHIGHLRNITTGESVVRLLEAVGHRVIRANYQGDVGLHIAKCLWGIESISNIKYQISNITNIHEKVEFLAHAYVAGNKAYEEDEKAKVEIETINKQIYAKDPAIYPLYEQTRKWSLEYFDAIYKRVGSHFDRLYFESETYEKGKAYVLAGVKKGIFEESDGAVIFPGKKFGLHNRVFITREGNTTYEGKDMGLGRLQFDEFHPDLIIHCVGSEQTGYFQVIIEALSQLFPDTKGKEHHLIYGWVRLKEGKMSSRTGNVILGEWLLDETKKHIQNEILSKESNYTKEEQVEIAEKAAIAAIKYSFLKVSTTQDIAFDFSESININGDSGPYLLYTYARCQSVGRKASGCQHDTLTPDTLTRVMNPEERAVARLILYFPEIVYEAASNYSPSALCSYLFQLAQAFNLFYAKHQILGNADQPLRLALTQATAAVLRQGLSLLGISTIERM